jgi:hypothetical protein
MIDMEEAAVINGLAGFEEEAMGDFLQAIRSERVSE